MHHVFEGDKGDMMVTEGLSQSWEGCYCLSEGSRLSDSLENSTLNRHLRQNKCLLIPQFSREFSVEKYYRTNGIPPIETCHPPVTLVTLKNRVHPQYLSVFCHPDTLNCEIFYISAIVILIQER